MLTQHQRSKIQLRPLPLPNPLIYKEAQYLSSLITTQEQTYIALWLDSLLQPWTKSFLHALNKSQKIGIFALMDYIKHFYSHVDQIIVYYVIACLMDISWFALDIAQSQPVLEESKYLNMIIEQASSKYFREHEWFKKIQHLPIFMIFSLLDEEIKGYLSVRQISSWVTLRLKKDSHYKVDLNRYVAMKFKQDPSLPDVKVNQQNLDELLQRVNLSNFIYFRQNIEKAQSETYRIISDITKLSIQNLNLQKDEETILDLKDKNEKLQALQIQQYSQLIKDYATGQVKLSKSPSATVFFNPRSSAKKKKPLNYNDENEVKFTFARDEDIHDSHRDNSKGKAIKIQDQGRYRTPSNQGQTMSRKTDNLSEEQLTNNQDLSLRDRCLNIKQTILSQLCHIKREKYENKSKIVKYI